MSIFEIISAIILILACVFIVVVILLKDTKTQMSQSISGTSADSFYQKNVGRTKEAILNKATIVATVLRARRGGKSYQCLRQERKRRQYFRQQRGRYKLRYDYDIERSKYGYIVKRDELRRGVERYKLRCSIERHERDGFEPRKLCGFRITASGQALCLSFVYGQVRSFRI